MVGSGVVGPSGPLVEWGGSIVAESITFDADDEEDGSSVVGMRGLSVELETGDSVSENGTTKTSKFNQFFWQ